MTTGRDPEDRRDDSLTANNEARRKLVRTLAVLTLLLVIILFILFYWWSEEGDGTDPEDVTRWTMVADANARSADALVNLTTV